MKEPTIDPASFRQVTLPSWPYRESKFIDDDVKAEAQGVDMLYGDIINLQLIKELRLLRETMPTQKLTKGTQNE